MLKTPNFSTLICYDRIFGDISYTMCSCTENEANHYGRFLCSVLETVMRWHRDRSLFEKECAKYPGFITKFSEADPVHVDYENYRHVCHKWHYRLTKALILCLDSEDYIQIRNSLVVLTKIIAFFPHVINFAQAIEKRVDIIREKEKNNRKDLYALATGYVGHLRSKRSSFVPEQEFHYKEVRKSAAAPAEPAASARNSPSLTPKNEKSPPVEIKKEKERNGERREKSGNGQEKDTASRTNSSNHTNDKRTNSSMPAPRIKVEKADRLERSDSAPKIPNSRPRAAEPQVRIKQEESKSNSSSPRKSDDRNSSDRIVSDRDYDRSREDAKRKKSTTTKDDYDRDAKRRKAPAAAAPEYNEKESKRRSRGSDRDSDVSGKRAFVSNDKETWRS
jgi:THO complex subunit 2